MCHVCEKFMSITERLAVHSKIITQVKIVTEGFITMVEPDQGHK